MIKKLIIVFFFVFCTSGNASAWWGDEDTFTDDKGTTYREQGNNVYSNTGVSYTVSGGVISGSDGSHYEKAGNTIYKDGKPACYVIRNQVFCEYAD